MKKHKIFFAACITAMISIFSIGSTAVMADNNIRPKSVSISKSTMSVYQGKEFEIKATMSPRKADDDYLRWEIISGKNYVRFDDDDRNDDEIELKALKPGKAKIRCYVKGKDKTKYGDVITVTVLKRKADTSLSIVGRASKTVEAGDDFDLEVKKGFSIKKSQLKWKIADTRIVQFDDNDRTGKEVEFRAKRPGTTTITCTCTNKNAKVKKLTFKVTVVPDDDDYDDYDDDDYDDYDDDYDD